MVLSPSGVTKTIQWPVDKLEVSNFLDTSYSILFEFKSSVKNFPNSSSATFPK